MEEEHLKYMKDALNEAHKALDRGEVPIGCVVVAGNRIIARGHNLTETLNDVTAHAEMQAITAAAEFMGGKYLKDCRMYVTLEPCVMCAGALKWAQIDGVYFGAYDEKGGYSKISDKIWHPKTKVSGGWMQEECRELLQNFFKSKRR